MGTTTNFAIPYPELTDPPDGAGQMKSLATTVDTQLKAVKDTYDTAQWLQVRRTANQAFATSATASKITFPTKDEDLSGMANVNGDDFTIKKAGVWSLFAYCECDPNGTGVRTLDINRNSAILASNAYYAPATWFNRMVINITYRLALNDVLSVLYMQNSGASLNLRSALFTALWVRP